MNFYNYVPYNHNDYYRNPQQTVNPQQILTLINPAVSHGLKEAQQLGYQHALTEAVAIGYLMGKGYDYNTAWKTVESWWRPPGTPIPTPY
ncbi:MULTISPECIES: hypothetical protein [Bacillaceae]|uniref:hypothetical protein n=1 Tax=Bacillaceae TaxID=186817 RepID=UPI000BEE6D78|nr:MULTISPECIES: hypothetical protein [unclassified Bacillus (in: firmicutes)]PEC49240.1 hypothetical protein CON00_11160 [Bacillus sp. AFS096315]PFM82514.1 hypothetical protein COJ46_05945 [Bacillus sp. AFS077874]